MSQPPLEVELPDGGVIRIRPIEPSDRDGLLAAFERLSARSRQLRFMIGKGGLSDEEARFYTDPDGEHHYAICAVALRDAREVEGIGTARYIRTDADPLTAEIAVTVVDAWQRRGIGRLLLEHLRDAAVRGGLARMRVRMLGENQAARALLARSLGEGTLERDGETVTGTYDIA